jgi:hypothetical protein
MRCRFLFFRYFEVLEATICIKMLRFKMVFKHLLNICE